MQYINLPDNEILGIAVSGGRDSMALLHFLLSKFENSKLFVINIEHGIRGQKSIEESEFVINECKRLALNYESISVDVLGYSKSQKLSIEQAARELRYREFNRLIDEKKVTKIALAHHKGDQAETVMMRILRGTGIAGLVGMYSNRDKRFIRPLLNYSRQDINHYIKVNNIKYVEDDSNLDNNYTRNYIRNKLFPDISKKFPDYENSLIRLSLNAKDDNDYIMSKLTNPIVEDNVVYLPVDCLLLHKSLASREIMLCFNALGVYADIERRHIDTILNIVNLRNGTRLDMPYDVKLYKEYEKIAFTRFEEEIDNNEIPFTEGSIELSDNNIKVIPYTGTGLKFDYDKIPSTAVIRFRKVGDMFTRFGGKSKSLGDYMTDVKIPKRLRNKIPLIACGNEILMILGYEISDKIKTDRNTKREYTIESRRKYEH